MKYQFYLVLPYSLMALLVTAAFTVTENACFSYRSTIQEATYPRSPLCRLWSSQLEDSTASTGENFESNPPNQRRKKKKNKYEKFSKANVEKDPLDALIEEAEQKNKELKESLRRQEEEKKPRQPKVEIAPLPTVEFPDTQKIDPYDPQTFGYLELGTIVGAHGVHGWVKCRSTTDFPLERLCTAGIRHLKPEKKRAPRQAILLQGKHRLGDEYLLQFEGVMDRDSAQRLRGATIYLREEQKTEKIEKEEFIVSDLVGLEVFMESTSTGEKDRIFVGKVGGVVFAEDICSIPGLGHDYLELILPRGVGGTFSLRDELVLVPFVSQIVPRVEIEDREIYIDPPAGLLDLTYVREEKTRIKAFLPSSCSK